MAVVFYGTFYVLEFFHDEDSGGAPLVPFEFRGEYLQLEDPYHADLLAAFEVVRARWSYEAYRTEFSGLDLDALESEALAILGDPSTKLSFHHALRHYIGGLKDGHAFVAFPLELFFEGKRWPFSLVEVAEGIMVYGVSEVRIGDAEVVPPDRRPLQGDLLISIDDRPVDAWIADTEKLVYASTDPSRRAEAIDHMVRTDTATERTFVFENQAGETYSWHCTLPPHYRSAPKVPEGSREPEHRNLAGNLGYYRPGSFSPPPNSGWPGPPENRDAILADSYAEMDRVIATFADADGLILDLRNNPGGTDLLGMYLVDRLVEGSYTYYRLSGDGKNGYTGFHKHDSTAPDGSSSFHGPLVCLIDEGTFSTADNVAACLEGVHPNVHFIGRPNGAGTGAPRSFELPRTQTTVSFCTMRVKTPNGDISEGRSVALQQKVVWTRADVLEGRDPDLDAAVAYFETLP